MRVTVDIGTTTTVSVVLSENNLRELAALVELRHVNQERRRGTYSEAPYLIKYMGDTALLVSVEDDLVHYMEEVKA